MTSKASALRRAPHLAVVVLASAAFAGGNITPPDDNGTPCFDKGCGAIMNDNVGPCWKVTQAQCLAESAGFEVVMHPAVLSSPSIIECDACDLDTCAGPGTASISGQTETGVSFCVSVGVGTTLKVGVQCTPVVQVGAEVETTVGTQWCYDEKEISTQTMKVQCNPGTRVQAIKVVQTSPITIRAHTNYSVSATYQWYQFVLFNGTMWVCDPQATTLRCEEVFCGQETTVFTDQNTSMTVELNSLPCASDYDEAQLYDHGPVEPCAEDDGDRDG